MITIEVNGTPIDAKADETLLTVLRRNQIAVPTLCHMPDLFPTGACRLCVVEIDGMPNLAASCSVLAVNGMKIRTHSPRVLEARKTIVELLLASHPDDCMYCERNRSCELQSLCDELGIRERNYYAKTKRENRDVSSPSIQRDPAKCILCGRCVRMCEEIQGVTAIDFMNRGAQSRVGTFFDQGLNSSSCVNCGQCILVCPTGALVEAGCLKEVMRALNDPEMTVVIQHAPAVSISIGEEFGLAPGTDVAGKMTAALRKMGVNYVFDTSFSADLTIMEEGSELVERVKKGGPFPMFTSCSPGWIKFVEQFYPEFLPNLSSCKSPQQMLGALIKSYFAEKNQLDPGKIFSVSLMPCTAKKFESNRAEMTQDGREDVDVVLTTREFAKLLRMFSIDLANIQPEQADDPFGERTSAGKLFGATGGVMEAAVRSAYFLITGTELEQLEIKAVRDLAGIKESRIKVGDLTIGIAVVSGLGNARKLLDEIKNGRNDLHFIEVMTCPGGCISGGGQPRSKSGKRVKERLQGLYSIDKKAEVRVSHKNQSVQQLYADYLGHPLSEKSHHLLHTHYTKRETVV